LLDGGDLGGGFLTLFPADTPKFFASFNGFFWGMFAMTFSLLVEQVHFFGGGGGGDLGGGGGGGLIGRGAETPRFGNTSPFFPPTLFEISFPVFAMIIIPFAK
jgi:hypothetical protein